MLDTFIKWNSGGWVRKRELTVCTQKCVYVSIHVYCVYVSIGVYKYVWKPEDLGCPSSGAVYLKKNTF